MVTSCFFCQNLLSDYIEGLLPSARHEDLKKHIDDCLDCSEVLGDLNATLGVLHAFPPRTLSPEMALRITQATQSGRSGWLSRRAVSRAVMVLGVPALLVASLAVLFPNAVPRVNPFGAQSEEAQFVRYHPLLQGAAEIIDEQSNWLHSREPFSRSLWEEGGLSPDDFEKSFQIKGQKVEEKEEE